MTIHAELSSEPGPDPAPRSTNANDSVYAGKFWLNPSLVPNSKTRHAISQIFNKKIEFLEYNSNKKDILIRDQAKQLEKMKKKNKAHKNRILKLCDISSDSS